LFQKPTSNLNGNFVTEICSSRTVFICWSRQNVPPCQLYSWQSTLFITLFEIFFQTSAEASRSGLFSLQATR